MLDSGRGVAKEREGGGAFGGRRLSPAPAEPAGLSCEEQTAAARSGGGERRPPQRGAPAEARGGSPGRPSAAAGRPRGGRNVGLVTSAPTTMKWPLGQAQTCATGALLRSMPFGSSMPCDELPQSTIRALFGAVVEVRRRRRKRGDGVRYRCATASPVGTRDHRLWTVASRREPSGILSCCYAPGAHPRLGS